MSYFSDVDEFLDGKEKTGSAIDRFPLIAAALGLVKAMPKMFGPKMQEAIQTLRSTVSAHPYSSAAITGAAVGAPFAMDAIRSALTRRAQDQVFNEVKRTDPLLHDADAGELASAFSTLRSFAPSLAQDPNATRSFLREAVTSGGGVSYNTINLLASTENAIGGDD